MDKDKYVAYVSSYTWGNKSNFGIRIYDVDMENGIIIVNHTLVYYNHRDEKGCYFSINTPKTKAGIREIPMTEGVKQAFLMEKEFQEECGMKSVSHI